MQEGKGGLSWNEWLALRKLEKEPSPLVISWGLSARQGKRPIMEDYHDHKRLSKHQGFFGVYDGHGGEKAAHYVANSLYNNFVEE